MSLVIFVIRSIFVVYSATLVMSKTFPNRPLLEGEICLGRHGEIPPWFCKRFRDCPSAVRIMKEKKAPPSNPFEPCDIKYADENPLICCPSYNISDWSNIEPPPEVMDKFLRRKGLVVKEGLLHDNTPSPKKYDVKAAKFVVHNIPTLSSNLDRTVTSTMATKKRRRTKPKDSVRTSLSPQRENITISELTIDNVLIPKEENIILPKLTVGITPTFTKDDGSQPKAEIKCNEYEKIFLEAVEYKNKHSAQPTVGGLGSGFITGGSSAELKEYLHMARLGYGDNPDYLCGGTLISERFVLTAAHCENSASLGLVSTVLLGELYSLFTEDDALPQSYSVLHRYPHPDYRPESIYHDIMLLELMDNVQFTGYIKPICLQVEKHIPVSEGIVTGWGRTAPFDTRSSTDLQKVELPFVSAKSCNHSLRDSVGTAQLKFGILDATQLCAGGVEGKDSCKGDSGGPIQIHRGSKMYTQVGIVSAGKKYCGMGEPGIYTRVSAYVPWIESIVWPESEPTPSFQVMPSDPPIETGPDNGSSTSTSHENEDDDDYDNDDDNDDNGDNDETDDDGGDDTVKSVRTQVLSSGSDENSIVRNLSAQVLSGTPPMETRPEDGYPISVPRENDEIKSLGVQLLSIGSVTEAPAENSSTQISSSSPAPATEAPLKNNSTRNSSMQSSSMTAVIETPYVIGTVKNSSTQVSISTSVVEMHRGKSEVKNLNKHIIFNTSVLETSRRNDTVRYSNTLVLSNTSVIEAHYENI